MIQFAISNGLNVRSTTFPHKDIRKRHGFQQTAITDIRQLRGPDIGSDHNLLKINFKVKLRAKTGNKYNEKRKRVSIFQNPKWKQQYAIDIKNKFEILENSDLLTIILTKNGKTLTLSPP